VPAPDPVMKMPYRILVLDDDEAALTGIVELLRDAGYVVTGAQTYDAAKRLLALDSYELLITDIRLRGFNGLHLVRQIYRDRPEMGLIIITGYDEPMIEVEAGRYGVGGFRVTVNGQPAAVVDVCYGGLRLEVPEGGRLPAKFDVEIAGIGLHLPVENVWCHPSAAEGGVVMCGATLTAEGTPAAHTWRAIVDRLSA